MIAKVMNVKIHGGYREKDPKRCFKLWKVNWEMEYE